MAIKGGKPKTSTPADRRLADNKPDASKPTPKPAPMKPKKG